MNHSFTLTMAQALADRVAGEAGSSDAKAQVACAFELAFGRAPKSSEVDAATALIAQHGLRAFCRALFNSNELIYVN